MIAKKSVPQKGRKIIKEAKKYIGIAISILAVLGVIFLVVKNFEMINRRAQLENKVLKLTNEIRKLEDQKASLQSQFNETQKEVFIEEQAREKLNLQKQGENAVVIEGVEVEEVDGSKSLTPAGGIIEKIKGIFK
ncbi:MAG: septum formation initiator family protein [bacterium]|nr:septum formation initiator family protein [bacterium]